MLHALSDRHRPRLQGLLIAHYDVMMAEGLENDPRSLLGVFVRPTIDYVFEGESPRAWVRILAQLAARPEIKVHDFVNNSSPQAMDTGTRLLDSLQAAVPRGLGFDRIFMITTAVLHLCADRSRIEDSIAPGRRQMSQHDFTENVVDMAHGALFATVREPAG